MLSIAVQNDGEGPLNFSAADLAMYGVNISGPRSYLRVYNETEWNRHVDYIAEQQGKAIAMGEAGAAIGAIAGALITKQGVQPTNSELYKRQRDKLLQRTLQAKQFYFERQLKKNTLFPGRDVSGEVYADYEVFSEYEIHITVGSDYHTIYFNRNGEKVLSKEYATQKSRSVENPPTIPSSVAEAPADSTLGELIAFLKGEVPMHASISSDELKPEARLQIAAYFALDDSTEFTFRWTKSMAPKGHPRHGSISLTLKPQKRDQVTIRAFPDGRLVE